MLRGARPRLGLRALLATVEIMFGVIGAHTVAGGVLPSLLWMLALTAVVFGSTVLVLRRRVRLRSMVPLLVVAQFSMHEAFTFGATAPQLHHHGQLDPVGHNAPLSWQMWAAHLASAVITALVWTIRRRLRAAMQAWDAVPRLVAMPRLQSRPTAPDGHDWLGVWLLGSPWRGPPGQVPAA